MLRYLARRLVWSVAVLWAVLTITFAATYLSAIDPARVYAGPHASPETYQRVRHDFGLDRPVAAQYWRYVERVVTGNLGDSYSTGLPVATAIRERLAKTGELAVAGIVIELLLGIPLGILAALRMRRFADRAVLVVSLFGVATPVFVVGFLLLYVFAYHWSVFPLGGSASLSALLLPALTLGLSGAAWYARILRSTMLNVLNEQYVTLARAKGLPQRTVIGRHVLRNAIAPVVAMIGLDMGVFLGGVLVIEQVFDWPGIGQQAWTALTYNDVPLILGTVLVAAAAVTLLNLIADIINAVLDPRAQYQ
jgi:peptide/nickel transport system permease protein